MNLMCRKDPYASLSIDQLINGSLENKTISFMDAYSSYYQIKMDPWDAPKMDFK